MSHYELYYYLVWSTKKRRPLITPALEPVLHEGITEKCEALGGTLHAIGGMPNHVHLLVSIPVTIAAMEFVRRVKSRNVVKFSRRLRERRF